jgi:hypothetical protein
MPGSAWTTGAPPFPRAPSYPDNQEAVPTLSDLKITNLDADGAIQEAHEALGGDTRGDFFKKAALGGGAFLGGGALLGGLPAFASGATRKSAKNDVKILNYALTLEYLEASFYKEAVKGGVVNGAALEGAKIVARHEADHVKALKKALGHAAVKEPDFDFQGTTMDQTKFIATAATLEDTGVAAYLGQAGNILNPKILLAAASILPVEARHASFFRNLNGETFAPLSFEKGKSMAAILKAVKKTGFIKS